MQFLYNYGDEFVVSYDMSTEAILDSIKYWSDMHRNNNNPCQRTTKYLSMKLGREIIRADFVVMSGYAFFPMTDEIYMIPQIEMALAVLEVHKL